MSESQLSFVSREALLAHGGRRFKEIDVPTLGKVRLASPSAASMLRFVEMKKRLAESGKPLDVETIAGIISAAIVDGNGKRMFASQDALELMDALDPELATTLMNTALELTGPSKSEQGSAPGNSEASTTAA